MSGDLLSILAAANTPVTFLVLFALWKIDRRILMLETEWQQFKKANDHV